MSQHLDSLNLVELIDELKPMAEPLPVSMIPQTVGWLFVLIALISAFAWASHRLFQHRQNNAYRRYALNELRQLSDDPVAIAGLLRRTALSVYPRSDVASLQGDDWLIFLDRNYGGNGFKTGVGQILTFAPYEQGTKNTPELTVLAKQWLIQHRRSTC